MRKHFKLFKIIFALTVFFAVHAVSFAQPPPPPPNTHGAPGNSPPGGGNGAPIGEGMFLLIGLAGIYGGKKILSLRKPAKINEV